MRETRFTDPRRMAVLRQAEGSIAVPELCREHGISSASFYKWRAKYGGMSEERDILKKGEPFSAIAPSTMASRFPSGMQSEIRVRGRASRPVFGAGDVPVPAHPTERALSLAAGTAEPAGVKADRRQTELLQKAWDESGKVYGYRKLHDDLVE